MKTQFRKYYPYLASVLLVVGGLSLACFLWVKQERRQYARNRELIVALLQGDFKRSSQLVEAGADPNTCVRPLSAPTWRTLWDQLLHRSMPSSNSPTVFVFGVNPEFISLLKKGGTTER